MVKRYDLWADAMDETVDGDYVTYSDYAELQDRSYELAIAILGGEDAPGLVDSTDTATIIDVLKAERRMSGDDLTRLMKSEARADALEDALRFYADDATDSKTDRPWAASDDFGYRARIALAQHAKVK